MKQLIHQPSTLVQTPDHTVYAARVLGKDRRDGTWEAWIEFHTLPPQPVIVLATERETTQPNRDALVYWATGLEPVYLEGALTRARQSAGAVPQR